MYVKKIYCTKGCWKFHYFSLLTFYVLFTVLYTIALVSGGVRVFECEITAAHMQVMFDKLKEHETPISWTIIKNIRNKYKRV